MRDSKGFTLIEIMIVVAIAGILASLAWSSYENSIMRSNRAEATTELSDLAQRLQKCYTTYGRYNAPPAPNQCAAFERVNAGYITRGKGFYRINIAVGATNDLSSSFIMTATAIRAPQTNDTRDGCDVLRLSNTGEKQPIVCW